VFGLLCFLVKKNPTARIKPHIAAAATHSTRFSPGPHGCRRGRVRRGDRRCVIHRARLESVHRRDERRERQSQSNSLTALCLPRSFATRAQGYRVEQPSPPPRESVRWDHSPLSRWRTANPSTGAAAADVKTRTRTRTRTPSERPLRVRARFGPELTARGAANAPQPASP
jgi:hypothetical protein